MVMALRTLIALMAGIVLNTSMSMTLMILKNTFSSSPKVIMIPKRQRLRPARQPAPYSGFEDRDEEDEDEAHFREIPEKDSFDYEVRENDTCPSSSYFLSLPSCLV